MCALLKAYYPTSYAPSIAPSTVSQHFGAETKIWGKHCMLALLHVAHGLKTIPFSPALPELQGLSKGSSPKDDISIATQVQEAEEQFYEENEAEVPFIEDFKW